MWMPLPQHNLQLYPAPPTFAYNNHLANTRDFLPSGANSECQALADSGGYLGRVKISESGLILGLMLSPH